jgi:hypothetical protein
MLTEGLFLDLLDHKFDDEQTFENDDEQFDPIETLSFQGLKTLHNHFSKVTTATSVKDIITLNSQHHRYGPTEMDNDGTKHGYDYQQYDRHIIGKETRYTER